MNNFDLEQLQAVAIPSSCPYCKSALNDLYYSKHHNEFMCEDCLREELEEINE